MKLVGALLLIMFSGCAHSVHLVHTSDFVPYASIESGEMIEARTEQFLILGFTGETDYVDQAYQKLMAACPSGRISGITTQISTSLGFFSWTNKALMQGLCLGGKAKDS
jgi:hypothetical protein